MCQPRFLTKAVDSQRNLGSHQIESSYEGRQVQTYLAAEADWVLCPELLLSIARSLIFCLLTVSESKSASPPMP